MASWSSSPDQDKESVAWLISQVLNTHYITLYVPFILKYKKTRKRPDDELVQGRRVFWIERNFADWYTSWQIGPTCWPKNICFISNQLVLPWANTVFKWMHWAAKPLEIMIKLNTFSCFFCQESHHHEGLKYFHSLFFALPLLRSISWTHPSQP